MHLSNFRSRFLENKIAQEDCCNIDNQLMLLNTTKRETVNGTHENN
jgi:hypothetical protein